MWRHTLVIIINNCVIMCKIRKNYLQHSWDSVEGWEALRAWRGLGKILLTEKLLPLEHLLWKLLFKLLKMGKNKLILIKNTCFRGSNLSRQVSNFRLKDSSKDLSFSVSVSTSRRRFSFWICFNSLNYNNMMTVPEIDQSYYTKKKRNSHQIEDFIVRTRKLQF